MKWFDEEAVTVQRCVKRAAWYFADQDRKRTGTFWRLYLEAFLVLY